MQNLVICMHLFSSGRCPLFPFGKQDSKGVFVPNRPSAPVRKRRVWIWRVPCFYGTWQERAPGGRGRR